MPRERGSGRKMPDIPAEAAPFETPFEGADTVSADSKGAMPEEAIQAAAEAMRARYVERFREPIKPVEEFDQDVRYIVEAAAPAIAAQVLRDLLAAAQSCTMCGEIHQRHPAKTDDGNSYMSWGHPEDGHAYFQASQEAAAWLTRQIGEADDSR